MDDDTLGISFPRYDADDREVAIEEIIKVLTIPFQFPKKDQIQLRDHIGVLWQFSYRVYLGL